MIIYYPPRHANSWLWCPLADYYVVIIIPTSLYTHLNATKDNAAQREFRLSYHRRIQEINSFIGFSTSHHDWNFITKSNNFNILPFTGLKWNHHVRRYKVFCGLEEWTKLLRKLSNQRVNTNVIDGQNQTTPRNLAKCIPSLIFSFLILRHVLCIWKCLSD